ncbi:hypothetical protein [Sphingomonas sp. TX0522]|uniref:hypothetical protein n=1 Tax=Sphingomonas sp. TX0522 TaxID=2479205 RepID=UPI0018DFF8D6|nr:hypothetical protein [Sphingomonas sp. TX0522]
MFLGPGQSGAVNVFDPGGTGDAGHFVFHGSSEGRTHARQKKKNMLFFFRCSKKGMSGEHP